LPVKFAGSSGARQKISNENSGRLAKVAADGSGTALADL
jgi:hypothetical protein